LAKLVGSYNSLVGLVMVGGAFIKHQNIDVFAPIILVGYVILIVYVILKWLSKNK
jgi:hypothetical protein